MNHYCSKFRTKYHSNIELQTVHILNTWLQYGHWMVHQSYKNIIGLNNTKAIGRFWLNRAALHLIICHHCTPPLLPKQWSQKFSDHQYFYKDLGYKSLITLKRHIQCRGDRNGSNTESSPISERQRRPMRDTQWRWASWFQKERKSCEQKWM